MLIGIICNTGKPEALNILPEFITWLKQMQANYVVDEALKPYLKEDDTKFLPTKELAKTSSVVLSFGGDGTLLSTARAVGDAETPILGVNLGGLGYLAEISPQELKTKFRDFFKGNYTIDDRMVLKTTVENSGEKRTFFALNDIVIDKGLSTRIIRLRTTIQGEYLNTYFADGLIISTPTGSTAYSLSAGGPILEPTMKGIIVNPICPHTLNHRPIVVRYDKVIEIETDPELEVQPLTCDGFQEMLLSPGAKVTVQRADWVVKLIRMKGKYFYHVLQEKLHWGE